MFATVLTFDDTPEDAQHGVDHVTDEVLPAMEQATGLVGLWLVDRASGKRITVMVWEDEDEMQAAMARVAELRERFGERVRPAPTTVERFEVYGRVVRD
jgi:hypothetical protein